MRNPVINVDAKVRRIKPGECLIGFQHVDAIIGPIKPNGEFSETKTVKIPPETVHVHMGITAVRMRGGKDPMAQANYFSGMTFQIAVTNQAGEDLEFMIKAHFVAEKLSDSWFGDFEATILCFGPCG
jgi:hypothetical protein